MVKETNATTGNVTDYLYGDDLIKQTKAANDSYYLYDGLGSARALSDGIGLITDTYDYSSFGKTLNQTGSTENNYLFTGEQYDNNLDKYYLRARYYDQNIGRFTQMDSWKGSNYRPLSLNKYIYGEADSVNNIDPSGKSIVSVLSPINVLLTLNTVSIGKAALYSTAIIGATAVAFDIADGFADSMWAISESTAEPKINSEADKIAYDQENRSYHNRCNEPPPPGLSQCELWRWKLRRNKDCADMREDFGKKWFNNFDSGHQQAIDDMRIAVNKLEKKISRLCD